MMHTRCADAFLIDFHLPNETLMKLHRSLVVLALMSCGLFSGLVRGDEKPPKPAAAKLVPLNKQKTVLLDRKGRRLLLKTKLVLNRGPLEMLLCKAQTKEHESILAIDSDAYVIHAGLLALGAQPGKPVKYEPEFQPPSGQKMELFVSWQDKKGQRHRVNAKRWIRRAIHRYHGAPLDKLPDGFEIPKESELRYDKFNKELLWFGPMTKEQRDELLKLSDQQDYRRAIQSFFDATRSRPLTADWVFAGSGFYEPENGERYYQAEAGNIICVANFGDAMIDLAIKSSAMNSGLLFEPWTERLPELGTAVDLEIIPDFKKPDAAPSSDRKAD